MTKLSELTVRDVADYIRLGELTYNQEKELTEFLTIARAFIRKYTGLPYFKLDKIEEMIIVCKVLCQDMYDNRAFYVDTKELNQFVKSILDLHSVNLL